MQYIKLKILLFYFNEILENFNFRICLWFIFSVQFVEFKDCLEQFLVKFIK